MPQTSYAYGEPPTLQGVTHHYETVHGTRIHIAEAGQGEPLILLHGWPQHWFMWHSIIPSLAAYYRVICPDMRGFGWSDAPSHGYGKEQLAADVIGLADVLGIPSFRLMGHDWGAWVGYLMCLLYPQRVQQFMALSIPPPFQRLDAGAFTLWRSWYMGAIAMPGLGPWLVRRGGLPQLLLRQGLRDASWTPETQELYLSQLRDPARAWASVALYRTFLTSEILPVLGGRYREHRLTMPTHLLMGDADPFLSPRLIGNAASYADNLTIHVESGLGHFVCEQAPDLVTEQAQQFFAGGAADDV